MKVSICLTVKNEGVSITPLLESLIRQSMKPDEIVIVDSCSDDETGKIIKRFRKKYNFIKLLSKNTTRSEGRNLAIKNAKNQIIAMTDGGCVADKNWLKNITFPFKKNINIVSAGAYKITSSNNFQKAAGYFLGTPPKNSESKYFPSARSVAFSKTVWETVGGFDEKLTDTAEDTMFCYDIVQNNIIIKNSFDAIVYWSAPDNLQSFANNIYKYAFGDAYSGIWFWPGKKKISHNIKILLKIIRYGLFILLPLLFSNYSLGMISIFAIYSVWAFAKVFRHAGFMSGMWGIIMQFVSDIYGIVGFINGMFMKHREKNSKFIFFMLFILILTLTLRSFVFLRRIYREFVYPVAEYYPEKTPCDNNGKYYTDEEEKYYFYKHYGQTCQNN